MAQPTTLREQPSRTAAKYSQPSWVGTDVGDVVVPGPVGRARVEQPPHQVRRRGGLGVGAGQAPPAAP